MSSKDYLELRKYMSHNPGNGAAKQREYFQALDTALRSSNIWPTTTTTTTTTSSTSSTTTA